jgi:threonylcarbamoyladenosine tRNA methylthiotransferase MtaB
MRRRYSTDLYRGRIEKIKALLPMAGIGADVITGFPGETDEDFRSTVDFIESLDVTYLHVFTYSERESTAAAEMPGAVPVPARKQRTAVLRGLSDRKRDAFYAQNAGREARVLFEAAEKGRAMMGYTENYVRVAMPYDAGRVNTVCRLVLEPGPERGLMSAPPAAAAYEAAGFAVQ